ncbi:MAG: hypothetical protein P8J91_09200 [Pirellulaceae bacterium]|nr:hypothetical protein [Pirellulaceae bacterium]MDG2103915.1 hypothetical protein [Pirellulaceae bacterium]
MPDGKNALQDLLETLTQDSEELKVQIHLAEIEAREEFQRLSGKLDELTTQFEPVKDVIADSADGVVSALTRAAKEMQDSFSRITESLKGTR